MKTFLLAFASLLIMSFNPSFTLAADAPAAETVAPAKPMATPLATKASEAPAPAAMVSPVPAEATPSAAAKSAEATPAAPAAKPAKTKQCKKGKPCGKGCIPANATCRQKSK